jgi:hypothetical protein
MSKRRSVDIQVGPDIRPVARRAKTPMGAAVIIGFLIIDVTKLHLLHHLLGPASPLVAFILFVVAVIWGIRKLGKKS